MNTPDEKEPWISVEEAAMHLGVQRDTIYKWITRRDLPAHKAGRLWKFRRSELDAWVMAPEPHDRSNGGPS